MPAEITLVELVRNGTMSEEVAALLWTAVDEGVSFLVVAVPRLAGKSTTSDAIMAMRPPDVLLHHVVGDEEEMSVLARERLGGYLVVAEFSDAPVPGYIWGEPVRRVFDTLDAGYSLQACLHAPSPEDAVLEVTNGNGVSDDNASRIGLIVYIERFGTDPGNFWRRIARVYELERVQGGQAEGHDLFQWVAQTDRFEAVDPPQGFARDREDLLSRGELLSDMARMGKTSPAEVQAAIARYRAERES
jgi:hypothetical protein